MNGNKPRMGVISQGIKTPIIKPGDNLLEIVIDSVAKANGGAFNDGDIIAITEAVVAISQRNFVTPKNISDDIARKFAGTEELVLVDPIQSRNRFLDVLRAIAETPTLEKIWIVMTYPTDEVGNRLVSDLDVMMKGVDSSKDWFTQENFYFTFGKPRHPFTGLDYLEEYVKACDGKATIILCNDFLCLPEFLKRRDALICSIHRRQETRKMLEFAGMTKILDLSEIMNESIDGSGYNEKYGLYGSNARSDGSLKLMPINCQQLVDDIQQEIQKRYGKKVEVMVYGDGAFKDPVGGIWELADPTTTLAATSGLNGTPKEVKLKFIASKHEGKTPEEIEAIVQSEKEKRASTDEVTGEASLGTTPRQITDLVASLCDLTTGSGDRQTPVVYVQNYL